MDVEGVGHDEGVGEHQADHVPVGDVAVHRHDLDAGSLVAAVETGEGPDGSAVPAGGDVDDDASFGVGEDRGEHERLAHRALVDGQAPAQPSASRCRGSCSGSAHGEAEVVVGDAEIPGHRRGGSAPGQVSEEGQRPLRGAAPADAFEPLIEGPLPAGLVRTDEAAHAHRQGDDQRADHVDDVPPARAVGVHRRMSTAGAQRRRMAASDMDHWALPVPVDGAEHVHVPAPQAQVDTVGHGPGSFARFPQEPKLGSRGRSGGGCPPPETARWPTLIHGEGKKPLWRGAFPVEPGGFEPPTSCMPCKRSAN